jgi:hypothetical protein
MAQAITLQWRVLAKDNLPTPPTLELVAKAPGGVPKAGLPVQIAAKATKGSFPLADAYFFVVWQRPANATGWIWGETQVTNETFVQFVPDQAGEWKVMATTLSQDPADPTGFLYSAQTPLKIDVQ